MVLYKLSMTGNCFSNLHDYFRKRKRCGYENPNRHSNSRMKVHEQADFYGNQAGFSDKLVQVFLLLKNPSNAKGINELHRSNSISSWPRARNAGDETWPRNSPQISG